MLLIKGIVGTLLLTVIATGLAAAQSRQKAPNFSLKTSNGTTVELAKLRDKLVLVNFWATWCGPCRAEIPGFLDVYKTYKDKGLEIVGVSLDEGGWDDVAPFVKKLKIDYPIVIGNEKISRDYGTIQAIPTTFIVGRDGYILERHVGYLSKEDLEKKLKTLLLAP